LNPEEEKYEYYSKIDSYFYFLANPKSGDGNAKDYLNKNPKCIKYRFNESKLFEVMIFDIIKENKLLLQTILNTIRKSDST
jgi:hypothetical protein